MPDNEVKVVFTGVDNVTEVADRIERGIKKANVSVFMQDSTFGETDAKTKQFIAEMRGNFEEARGELEKTTETIKELDKASKIPWQSMGLAAAALTGIIIGVNKEFQEIVELSKEKPELFTDEELRNAEEYGSAINEINNVWTELKITAGTPIMGIVATDLRALLDIEGALDAIKQGNLNDWAANIINNFSKGAEAAIEWGDTAIDVSKDVSKEYKNLLSQMGKVQDINEKFSDDEQDRADKIKEIEEDKVRAVIESSQKIEELERDKANLAKERASALAKIEDGSKNAMQRREDVRRRFVEKEHDLQVRIDEARNKAAIQQIELGDKIAEVEKESTEAIEDKEKALKELLYAQLESKAAAESSAGGAQITKEEFEFLQNMQVELGLTDAASANAAIAIADDAQTIWDAFTDATGGVNDVQTALDAVVHGSPYVAQIVIETVGGVPQLGGGAANAFVNKGVPVARLNKGADRDVGILDFLAQETTKRQTR